MHEQPMSASVNTSTGVRPSWLVVGVLAVAVAGLGGTLLGTQLPRGAAGQTASTATGLVPFDATSAPATSPAAPSVPVTSAKPQTAPAVVRAPVAATAPVARCDTCGTVVSVNAVQRAAPASGIGAVAGGVLGGVLGNQVGGGSGRAVATVVGAVGGGWAGNETEKRMRQTTHYAVRVRMDDGSTRTVEQSTAVAVGSPVVVQGGSVRLRGPVSNG